MKIRFGGEWREITSAKAFINGAWRTIRYGKAYASGSWRDAVAFVPALTLAASPESVSGVSTLGTVVTNGTTVTPTGGVSPYTYAWTRVSGVGEISSPTSASTAFYYNAPGFANYTGTFRCTVTDSLGTTATADVDAEFERQPA
jgi:hypothetical protein